MKCLICKGEMIDGFTTHVEDFGDYIIRIKDVPCFKCEQCGEISYSGNFVKLIERMIIAAADDDLKKGNTVKHDDIDWN